MATILVASTKYVLPHVRAALAGQELLEALNMQEAQRLVMKDGIELFVIGVHFDDSRAMELVKFIRLDPKHSQTPIVVVRLTPTTMADYMRQTMDTMKSLQVISDYLELEGDPAAQARIQEAVTKLLLAQKGLHSKQANLVV